MKSNLIKKLCMMFAIAAVIEGTYIKADAIEYMTSGSQVSIECTAQLENRSLEYYSDEEQFNSYYVSEQNYKQEMDNRVMPYIESRLKSQYITGVDNVRLYCEMYNADNSKGNIVISHGYTESLEKYHEIIYYFLNNGYNVFGIEHRGHGRSGSLGVADKTQIHVEKFDDYITDFKTFMDEVVIPNSENKDLYLYAHSMGGCIGAGFLEQHPEYFDKAVLNAPMLQINTGKIPELAAKAAVKTAVLCGQGGKYMAGKGPFKPSYTFNSSTTSSENRWSYINDIINAHEEFQRGDGSNKWADESFEASENFIKKENASKVEIPVMLFQAGEDTFVKDDGENKFAEYAKNCKLVRIEGSKHAIYFEKDEIQKPYLEQVLEFYKK
ncbi:MAG: alpha/beta fold hydrolase [Clostridium sp.]